MPFRSGLLAAILAAVMVGSAPSAEAQQVGPNPALVHYRAYRAALEAGDFAAAETSAAAALEASEARDGDGGSTAAFAYNLASLRMELDEPQRALDPARRAHALIQAGRGGVPPVAARLLLARVRFALEGEPAITELNAAIEAADLFGGPAEELWPAASELGSWGMQNERYDLAEEAWSVAASHVSGALIEPHHATASARIGEGAAILMRSVSGAGAIRRERAEEAHTAFGEAMDLMRADARIDQPGDEVTFAQHIYAQALVWDNALRARVMLESGEEPQAWREAEAEGDGSAEIGSASDSRPRCFFAVTAPRIWYPPSAAHRSQVGAVVVRLRIDSAGQVFDNDVVASAGPPSLTRAIMWRGAAGGWRAATIRPRIVAWSHRCWSRCDSWCKEMVDAADRRS